VQRNGHGWRGDRGGAGRPADRRNPEVEKPSWKRRRGRGGLSPASRVGVLGAWERGQGIGAGVGAGEEGERGAEEGARGRRPAAAVGRHSAAKGQGPTRDGRGRAGGTKGFVSVGAARGREEEASGGSRRSGDGRERRAREDNVARPDREEKTSGARRKKRWKGEGQGRSRGRTAARRRQR